MLRAQRSIVGKLFRADRNVVEKQTNNHSVQTWWTETHLRIQKMSDLDADEPQHAESAVCTGSVCRQNLTLELKFKLLYCCMWTFFFSSDEWNCCFKQTLWDITETHEINSYLQTFADLIYSNMLCLLFCLTCSMTGGLSGGWGGLRVLILGLPRACKSRLSAPRKRNEVPFWVAFTFLLLPYKQLPVCSIDKIFT